MNTYKVTFHSTSDLSFKTTLSCESTDVLYQRIREQLDNKIPFQTDSSLKTFMPIIQNISFIEFENIKVGESVFNNLIQTLNSLTNEQLQNLFNKTKNDIIATAFKNNINILTQNYGSYFKDHTLNTIIHSSKNYIYDDTTYSQSLSLLLDSCNRILEKNNPLQG